jgi:branched-chain amino acid transport system substrate-binding protein
VRRAAALVVVALAPLAGCGGGNAASTRITSDTLTIYTGLPLRGHRADEGRAVLRGEKLALQDAGGHVDNLTIGLIALDDTNTNTGDWDPGRVAENARQAAENPTTIAYIGDLNSGATAVSVPITNEIGVLQVSPLSSYTGLTQPADKGEPDKYYPSGKRTFARLVPTGAEEAGALATLIRQRGFGRVSLAYDGLQEGLGQGGELERALHDHGIQVIDVVRLDPHDGPADVASDARDLVADPAPAVIYAGASTTAAVALLRAVADRDPGEALFATSGVADRELAIGLEAVTSDISVTSPLLPLSQRPPVARRVAAHYRQEFGSSTPAAALYGYEAMRSVLDAIRRAGHNRNDRQAVIDSYFHTAVADSVLGPYAIEARGDTTATTIGGFRVQAGRLRFDRLLPAPAG